MLTPIKSFTQNTTNNTNPKITFIDLFAGIGGFRVAFEEIGSKCLFSCEINKDCQKTYYQNFSDNITHGDISTLNEKSVPYADIICAGFPCQPFSIAGNRGGFNDSRSSVFFDLLRIVNCVQPAVLFIENVPNLVNHNGGKTFSLILESIKENNYIPFYKILNSKDFGIPQARKRVYLVAFRKDLHISNFNFSIPNIKEKTVRDILIENDNSIPISDKWNKYIDYYTGKIQLSDISFKLPKTRQYIERIDKDTNLNDCIFQIRSSGIRALSLDKPFPTFAVSISGGGAMIPVLSKEKRHLSLREMGRIMGYNDKYNFPVSRTNAIKQLANSVCPPVIKHIAKDIQKKLLDIKYL